MQKNAYVKKKTVKLISIIFATLLLTACGTNDSLVSADMLVRETDGKTSGKETMLEEAVLDYEVPVSLPNMVVDTTGYQVGTEKLAIITGDTVPAFFEIINAETGKAVYEGSVKRNSADYGDELTTAVADFSELDVPGKYYVQAEILGRSKLFEIKDNQYIQIYKKAFKELTKMRCEKCHTKKTPFESDASKSIDVSGGWHTAEEGQKDVVEMCRTILDLCTAYEYYPLAFGDDTDTVDSGNGIPDIVDEIIYGASWLLKMQNTATGGVYTSVSLQTSGKDTKNMIGGETTRATAYFCATMAKVSMITKKHNPDFSATAIQSASLAWKCLEVNKDIVGVDQKYRAATEMYRATGQTVYNSAILDYLKLNVDKACSERLLMDGSITYLSTARATNVEYCTTLMSSIMKNIRARVTAEEESRYLVYEKDITVDDILRNAEELIVVDYINSSNEYVKMEENYLHYLCGRNAKSIDYIEILTTPDSFARLIAVAGKLTLEFD